MFDAPNNEILGNLSRSIDTYVYITRVLQCVGIYIVMLVTGGIAIHITRKERKGMFLCFARILMN